MYYVDNYFFFNSEMENNILFQICGRLYLSNIPIKYGVIHPSVHGFFDGSGQAVIFSSNYLKIVQGCYMATIALM